jgi:hypothetical protein
MWKLALQCQVFHRIALIGNTLTKYALLLKYSHHVLQEQERQYVMMGNGLPSPELSHKNTHKHV